MIEIIFPRGALDTPTKISVELLLEKFGLPVETKHASAFTVKPYSLELYQPVTISITYNKVLEDIRRTALYRNRGAILAPLAYHKYGVDSKSIEAQAFRLGEFVEGEMSVEEIINQVTLIFDSYGISWGSSNSFSSTMSNSLASTASTSFRQTWNKVAEDALAQVEHLRNLNYLVGDYDPTDACEIVSKGVEQMLDMKKPGSVCDKDYFAGQCCFVHFCECR